MVAEAADLLLRVEGAQWSMCMGPVEGWLHISLRTVSRGKAAGEVARQLAGRKGHGGGHQTLAAAQIPLPQGNDVARKTRRMVGDLRRRFLRATGGMTSKREALC
jgi:nanoRNase/pAp phosphatase (c-di-AMP/oligoRNAs hydrolase)